MKPLQSRSPVFRWHLMMWLCNYRTRLLLGLCVFLMTFFFAGRFSSIMGWRHLEYQSKLLTSSVSRQRFTVLINTWKRYDLLKKSVHHYSSCSNVDAIRVVWSEVEPPSNSLLSALRYSVKGHSREITLRVDTHDEDNLNNRFKPLDGVTTQAIFSVDDDVVVPCDSLNLAFSVWLSASDSMVGFVPRMHWLDFKKFQSKQLRYTYGDWWSVWWTGTYSMVLTKAAFLHHKYLDMYTYHMPSSFRDYVTKERNCEDIAMSFLIANATGAPPVWVKGKIDEIGSTGISSLKGHNHHRTDCLNKFMYLYGYMPLNANRVKAVDARTEWLW